MGQNKFSCNYGFEQPFASDLLIDLVHDSFIVQGSDSNDPIRAFSYTSSPPGSESLQTAAANTQTGINNPFQNFPGENDVLGSGVKNPYDVWAADYNN